ncbi:hypothetical protein D3C78_1419650 [compost metagenome]
MATESVATSSSPSVTVTVASRAPLAMLSDSSWLAPGVGCQIEAYWAMLSTPLSASMVTTKAALPSSSPPEMRPTTSPFSSYSRMLWPSVVSSPESTPAAETSRE